MNYILQMIVDEGPWQDLSPDEMQPMIDAMNGYNDRLRAEGAWVSGEGLDFSRNAKTVRFADGQQRVDEGPHDPDREQFAGF